MNPTPEMIEAAEHAIEDQMASDDNHPKDIAKAALTAALAVMPKAGGDVPDDAKEALAMVRCLANTPPEEWRSKAEIHAELHAFRRPSPSRE